MLARHGAGQRHNIIAFVGIVVSNARSAVVRTVSLPPTGTCEEAVLADSVTQAFTQLLVEPNTRRAVAGSASLPPAGICEEAALADSATHASTRLLLYLDTANCVIPCVTRHRRRED